MSLKNYQSMKVSEKYETNLRFVHWNFQEVSETHMQLRFSVNDMGKNGLITILKAGLHQTIKSISLNVAPKTH